MSDHPSISQTELNAEQLLRTARKESAFQRFEARVAKNLLLPPDGDSQQIYDDVFNIVFDRYDLPARISQAQYAECFTMFKHSLVQTGLAKDDADAQLTLTLVADDALHAVLTKPKEKEPDKHVRNDKSLSWKSKKSGQFMRRPWPTDNTVADILLAAQAQWVDKLNYGVLADNVTARLTELKPELNVSTLEHDLNFFEPAIGRRVYSGAMLGVAQEKLSRLYKDMPRPVGMDSDNSFQKDARKIMSYVPIKSQAAIAASLIEYFLKGAPSMASNVLHCMNHQVRHLPQEDNLHERVVAQYNANNDGMFERVMHIAREHISNTALRDMVEQDLRRIETAVIGEVRDYAQSYKESFASHSR